METTAVPFRCVSLKKEEPEVTVEYGDECTDRVSASPFLPTIMNTMTGFPIGISVHSFVRCLDENQSAGRVEIELCPDSPRNWNEEVTDDDAASSTSDGSWILALTRHRRSKAIQATGGETEEVYESLSGHGLAYQNAGYDVNVEAAVGDVTTSQDFGMDLGVEIEILGGDGDDIVVEDVTDAGYACPSRPGTGLHKNIVHFDITSAFGITSISELESGDNECIDDETVTRPSTVSAWLLSVEHSKISNGEAIPMQRNDVYIACLRGNSYDAASLSDRLSVDDAGRSDVAAEGGEDADSDVGTLPQSSDLS